MFDGISLDFDSNPAHSMLKASQVLWLSKRGCHAIIECNDHGLFSWSYRVECLCDRQQLFRGREHSGAAASAEAIRWGTSLRCMGVQGT